MVAAPAPEGGGQSFCLIEVTVMWTRSLLKQNAKGVLSHSYWRAFVACLVTSIANGGATSMAQGLRLQADLNGGYWMSRTALIALVVAMLAGMVISLAVTVFVGLPLTVGCSRMMMENRVGNPPFSTLTSVFGQGYGNVVKGMVMMNLVVLLWGALPMIVLTVLGVVFRSLLLLLLAQLCMIPMLYKSLQLVMVPYLLAENPYMNGRRARQLSAAMTQGEKWRIFVLGLSFLGWMLLGALLCGVGLLFVSPYIQATYAELYAALRAKAFSLGITSEEELGGFVRY